MVGFSRARWPQHAVGHRFMLWVLVIAGLALALVAMHSLSLDHASSAMSTSTAPHHDAMTLASGNSTSSDDCGGSCTPQHSMIVAGCILALVSFVFVAARIRTSLRWRPVRARTASLAASLAFLPIPDPPSLHALSISRT
jgi:hypothetical protein